MESATPATKEAKRSLTQTPPTTATRKSNEFGWWWETVSVLISIVFTVGIVLVLALADKKQLPHWRYKKPVPNAIVAILSTVAKSALLFPLAECLGQLKWAYFEDRARPVNHLQVFDGASRGPWGSFLFLWEVRGKALLASLGALVTILALSFDTFTQLAIDYNVHMDQFHNETGSLYVARKWQNGWAGNLKEQDMNLYVPVTAGILAALGDEQYVPSPNFECRRPRCQINDVSMLGVCTKCDTQTIVTSTFDSCTVNFQERMSDDGHQKPIRSGSYEDLVGRINSLPTTKPDYDLYMTCNKDTDGFPQISVNLDTHYDDTLHGGLQQPQPLRGVYSITQDFQMLEDHHGGLTLQSAGTDNVPKATLRFCIYDNSTTEGTLTLARASCFSSTTDMTQYQDIHKLGQINGTLETCDLHLCEKHYDNITIQNGIANYTKERDNTLILDDASKAFGAQSLRATADSSSKAVYEIHTGALADMTTRFLDIANKSKDVTDWNIVYDVLKPSPRTGDSALDDFPLLFSRFANMLTSTIQAEGNPDNEKMDMQIFDNNTFVHVVWPYLTVPLFIVAFVAVFLGVTVVRSRRSAYLLKTSSLAVMYHGLEARDWVHGGAGVDVEGGEGMWASDKELVRDGKGMDALFVYDEGRMKLKRE